MSPKQGADPSGAPSKGADPIGAAFTQFAALVFLSALALSACGGGGGSIPPGGGGGGPSPSPVPTASYSPSGDIKHIIVIIQENRSFDNLFHGFPGANTVNAGSWNGQSVTLQPFELSSSYTIEHTHGAFRTGFDGGAMDGFGNVTGGDFGGKRTTSGKAAYVYAPQNEVQPYWDIASAYALSDATFESYQGPSFVSHLFMIAGQAAQMSENPDGSPWGCDAPAGTVVPIIDASGEHNTGLFPCVTMTTIADELDAGGISWRYYAPALDPGGNGNFGENWSAFDAVRNVRYGPDWVNVVSPETQVLSDIQAGKLARVSWVVPSLNNSDHPGHGIDNGPEWVTSIVNEVEGSKYWSDCAVFVVWDDWGGWYDHVPPHIYDYEGLGFRVPLIAVSPFAKKHYVSHVQYETASLLRFIENQFSLATLGGADTRAGGLDDLFDFTQAPRSPKAIRLRRGAMRKVIEAAHSGPPDDD